VIVSVITYFYFEPLALIPLILGVLLNIIYEYAKGHGLWGNIIFGLMISMCSAYGFLASGPPAYPIFTPDRVAVVGLVWLMNSIMTYYTYFKDYEGDKLAGKKTLVVRYGIEKAKWIGVIFAFIPALVFFVIYSNHIIPVKLGMVFWILGLLTLFLEVWTGYLYYKNPVGEKTYYSLSTNFRACACGQATFVAIYNEELALILFLISYIFIEFLFALHQNREA
jgi:geranylgeranylglycerol-phosphate geranylgeranyltransferase